jgi:uncharacterized coiled-coil DUF342 family protein
METMNEHAGKMETQLKELGGKLDALVAKAEKANAAAKVDYRKGVDDVRAKFRVAHAKLDELKQGGSDKWETLKVGVETAWADLEVAFKKLAN